jgi:predicted transcriptional regulator of viral defense system
MKGGDRRSRAFGAAGGVHDRVLDLIFASGIGEHWTADRVADALSVRIDYARSALSKLCRQGKIDRTRVGTYRIA